jgi:hypothetical protein
MGKLLPAVLVDLPVEKTCVYLIQAGSERTRVCGQGCYQGCQCVRETIRITRTMKEEKVIPPIGSVEEKLNTFCQKYDFYSKKYETMRQEIIELKEKLAKNPFLDEHECKKFRTRLESLQQLYDQKEEEEIEKHKHYMLGESEIVLNDLAIVFRQFFVEHVQKVHPKYTFEYKEKVVPMYTFDHPCPLPTLDLSLIMVKKRETVTTHLMEFFRGICASFDAAFQYACLETDKSSWFHVTYGLGKLQCGWSPLTKSGGVTYTNEFAIV